MFLFKNFFKDVFIWASSLLFLVGKAAAFSYLLCHTRLLLHFIMEMIQGYSKIHMIQYTVKVLSNPSFLYI